MKAKNLRGVLTLPMNMLGWVAMITVFAVIMMFILGFLVQFQTLPKEAVEKPTACDVAYMISLWNEATKQPNIFNQDFLEMWGSTENKMCPSSSGAPSGTTGGANSDDTANIIFEKYSQDFFMPDSDIYLEITSKDQVYKMYLPPESGSVFCQCARPTYTTTEPVPDWTLWDFFKTGDYFEQKRDFEAYKKDLTTYNAIRAECQLPSFVASGDNLQPASVKAGLTTNLATRLRDGIYRVGVSGDKSAYYPLGPYPEGCIVNEGAVKVSNKIPGKYLDWFESVKRTIISIVDWAGSTRSTMAWIDDNKLVATCGFNWSYQRTCQITCKSSPNIEICKDNAGNPKPNCWQASCDGNILTCPTEPTPVPNTDPQKYICTALECTTTDLGLNNLTVFTKDSGENCPLITRIPNYIVEESKLSDKICTPKAAFTRVWLPDGDFSNYQYFLKVESARSSWKEADEASFCKNRCKEDGPWWWVGGRNAEVCQAACEFLSKDNTNCQLFEKDIKSNDANSGILNNFLKVKSSADMMKKYSPDAVRMDCKFAQQLIHTYRNLPEDAINVRYIVVTSDKLAAKSFAELTEDDYYATESACGTWKSICDLEKAKMPAGSTAPACCASAQDCNGLDCIAGECEKCSEDYWGFCSPAYLTYPISLGFDSKENGLFKCQNVYDQSYPLNIKTDWCLPALKVSAYQVHDDNLKVTADKKDLTKDKPLVPDEAKQTIALDCKITENNNAVVRWRVDASGLCCPMGTPLIGSDKKEVPLTDGNGKVVYEADGKTPVPIKVCGSPPEYCLNMKFWPNFNSSNQAQMIPQQIFYEKAGETKNALTNKDYVFEIVQQVCRGGKPFNGAAVAFVTANYPVNGRTFQYSVEGSEIELKY